LIVILLGPPGSGKGTQAKALVKRFSFPHISTGDIFRANLTLGTPLGLEVKSYLSLGQLVPDELVVRLVLARLTEPDVVEHGALLDGFPRTLVQAQSLSDFLSQQGQKITACLYFDLPDDELIIRLIGRMVCRDCGRNWHEKFNPPPSSLICDSCGGSVIKRGDDAEETAIERLKVYRQQTKPLVDWYEERGLLKRVQSFGNPSEVALAVEKALNS
jgi:adenylate kinase